MQRKAKFSVGQVIKHQLFLYRGIIFDVDYSFSESEEWYQQLAEKAPEKDQPWYRVMVDGENYETYVPEIELEVDEIDTSIEHPALMQMFSETKRGYKLRERLN